MAANNKYSHDVTSTGLHNIGILFSSLKKGPRKIKFLDKESNWLVFEEDEKLYATHFCNGGANTPHAQAGIKQTPFFHKAVNLETSEKCAACQEDIPKHLLMIVKVANAPL